MSELTPITRVESYLDAIVNSGIPPTENITRIETFLQAIYDNTVCQLTPITRIEMFLGKISGQDIVLPEPITRIELYLAAIAGEDVELPENPITRLEMYLAEWADSGDWATISGAIVEFITQRAHKLKSCVVSLSPKQDLSHGDPSPTNICPISGWTGVSVYDTGHNVWDEEWELGLINTDTGEPSPSTAQIRTKNFVPVVGGERYCFRREVGAFYICFYDKDNTFLPPYIYATTSDKYAIVTAPNNARYCKFYVYGTEPNSISINYPSTDTEYHAYNGNSYSVTWEDEVYGATPDVVSGEMPVTMVEVDMGSLTWSYANSIFVATLPSESYKYSSGVKAISDCYAFVGTIQNGTADMQDKADGSFALYYNANYPTSRVVYVKNTAYTDATAFKSAMNGHQLVYELAEPIETTITPTPITALSGYNAMWSDGGDITVTVKGTPVELSTLQALNMLLGGAYRNDQTADDVSDEEALEIILGGEQR